MAIEFPTKNFHRYQTDRVPTRIILFNTMWASPFMGFEPFPWQYSRMNRYELLNLVAAARITDIIPGVKSVKTTPDSGGGYDIEIESYHLPPSLYKLPLDGRYSSVCLQYCSELRNPGTQDEKMSTYYEIFPKCTFEVPEVSEQTITTVATPTTFNIKVKAHKFGNSRLLRKPSPKPDPEPLENYSFESSMIRYTNELYDNRIIFTEYNDIDQSKFNEDHHYSLCDAIDSSVLEKSSHSIMGDAVDIFDPMLEAFEQNRPLNMAYRVLFSHPLYTLDSRHVLASSKVVLFPISEKIPYTTNYTPYMIFTNDSKWVAKHSPVEIRNKTTRSTHALSLINRGIYWNLTRGYDPFITTNRSRWDVA